MPQTETLKIRFTCTVVLKAVLEQYAAMYSQAYGEPVDVATLIPHMLETYIARDRGFRNGSGTKSAGG